MKRAIRNMNDVKAFVERFNDGDIWIFRDSSISMVGGGATEIKKRDDSFYQFSQGPNWRDQEETYIADIHSFVWKNRADIRRGEWL